MPENSTLANHPAIADAVTVYIESNKDIDAVDKFFQEKFKRNFSKKDLKDYFDNLDDSNLPIKSRNQIYKELHTTSMSNESEVPTRIIMIQEMAWKRMMNIYIGTENSPNLNTKEEKNMHRQQTKEFVDLAKMYREYHQMKLEILGMGKTEEEAKAEMESYVAGMLKRAIQTLDDNPKAQKKLADFLNMTMDNVQEDED